MVKSYLWQQLLMKLYLTMMLNVSKIKECLSGKTLWLTETFILNLKLNSLKKEPSKMNKSRLFKLSYQALNKKNLKKMINSNTLKITMRLTLTPTLKEEEFTMKKTMKMMKDMPVAKEYNVPNNEKNIN